MIDMDELIKSCEIFRDKMIFALTGKGKQIMLDIEKVIKGLEHCDFGGSGTCYEKECPYYQRHDCTDELKNHILFLLKEQEAMVPIHAVADWLAGYAVPPSKTSLDHAEMAAAWTKFLEQLKE